MGPDGKIPDVIKYTKNKSYTKTYNEVNMINFLKKYTLKDLHIALYGYVNENDQDNNKFDISLDLNYFMAEKMLEELLCGWSSKCVIRKTLKYIEELNERDDYDESDDKVLAGICTIDISDEEYDLFSRINKRMSITTEKDITPLLRNYKKHIHLIYGVVKKYKYHVKKKSTSGENVLDRLRDLVSRI
jgi:hypothetical protein